MKKAFLLGMVIVLAFGLLYAWADQPTITQNHQPTEITVDQQETAPAVNERALGSDEVPVRVYDKIDPKAVAEEAIEAEIDQDMIRLQNHKAMEAAKSGNSDPVFIILEDDCAPGDSIQVTIDGDSYYSETSWALYDRSDPPVEIASGAPASGDPETWQVCVAVDQCYDFYIYDSYGDGIYSPGYCEVFLNNVSVLFFEGDFDNEATGQIGNGCVTQTGRCCYYDEDPPDLFNPICADDVTDEDCTTLIGAFSGAWDVDLNCTDDPCTVPPANDDCANKIAIGDGVYYVNTDMATSDTVGYANQNVWYCYTAPATGLCQVDLCASDFDTKVAVYDGCVCDPLGTLIASNDDNFSICGSGGASYLEFDAVMGVEYMIECGGYGTNTGNLVLDIATVAYPTGRCCYYDEDPPDLFAPICADGQTEAECDVLIDIYSGAWDEGLNCTDDPCLVPPPNDDCADMIAIGEGVYYVNTTFASTDGVGTHAINQNVWYCYTASDNGLCQVSLCDSDFDTKVAAYETCVCDPLGTEMGYNDDNSAVCEIGSRSYIEFTVVSGQTYLIEAGAYGSNTGNLVLDVSLLADPAGRCCYGDIYAPSCIENTESECATLEGVWTLGLNCTDDPCVPACYEDELMIVLDTDTWGSETTWDVINHDDPSDTIASGGPYASSSHFEEQVCFDSTICIDVYIYDAYGDGGPDYELYYNDELYYAGTLAGFGAVFGPIGADCALGACCDDITGVCTDDVAAEDCQAPLRWAEATLCADLDPPCVPQGACCYEDAGLPQCAIMVETECDLLGGTFTAGGSCEDCGTCADAYVDNGAPFDDWGSPASQFASDYPFACASADDFTLVGAGSHVIDMVTAWTSHWNGPNPNPALYTAVKVTIFANYDSSGTDWPAGYIGDDGVAVEYVAGGVVFTEDATTFSYWPFDMDCTGETWQINVALTGCSIPEGKYWISIQPIMPFSGGGQLAVVMSGLNTGDAAFTNFPLLGTPPWVTYGGNAGTCDSLNYPAGSLTDIAFCLHGYNEAGLYGNVTDGADDIGIPDVNVEIGTTGFNTQTDGTGLYIFTSIPAGTHDIVFTHPDYQDVVEADFVIAPATAPQLDAVMTSALTTIYDVQYQETLGDPGDDCLPSPWDGLDAVVTGVVTAVTQGTYPNYYIQDCATSDWNGVYVYDITQVDMQVGDNVTLRGEVDEYYGLTELKNVESFVTNTTGDVICTTVVTASDIFDECGVAGEPYEGMLVRLNDVTVQSTASGGRAWLTLAGSDELLPIELDDDLYRYGTDQPDSFEVGATYPYIIGVMQYTYGNYELWPRFASDVADLGFQYVPGDCNMENGLWPPQVIGADVTYLVNYFIQLNSGCKIDGNFMSADVNADCLVIGSDVTRMVNYFRQLGDIEPCPDWTPLWPTPEDAPETAPSGWPPCDPPPPASTPEVIPGDLIK